MIQYKIPKLSTKQSLEITFEELEDKTHDLTFFIISSTKTPIIASFEFNLINLIILDFTDTDKKKTETEEGWDLLVCERDLIRTQGREMTLC